MSLQIAIGQRFGLLVVLEYEGEKKWRCICDCGVIVVTRGYSLRSGNTGSCGCRRRSASSRAARDRNTKHGQTKTPTWSSWRAMVQRCTDPNVRCWKNYGGRGIKVCERWLGENGFVNFLADVGERPDGRTLDRFPDGNGNYEPGNVRWATAKEQAANQRPRVPPKIKLHQRAQIAWLAEMGWNQSEIAAQYGISQTRASQIVRAQRRGETLA
jgi:hypothetical protein